MTWCFPLLYLITIVVAAVLMLLVMLEFIMMMSDFGDGHDVCSNDL